MSRFKNEQNITAIEFMQNVQCFCPLGNDWYTNQITVEFEPTDTIPDYCEVDDFVRGLSGKSLLIEDVVASIYNYVYQEYSPAYLRVSSKVDDAKHLPVTVTKQSK